MEKSDYSDEEIKRPSDMEKRRKVLERARRRQEKKEQKEEIEIVPEQKFEDYDINGLAETLALGKTMLRKKNREEIIESSISRYAFDDEEKDLPNWFVEDEKRHNYINLPITKEEF